MNDSKEDKRVGTETPKTGEAAVREQGYQRGGGTTGNQPLEEQPIVEPKESARPNES